MRRVDPVDFSTYNVYRCFKSHTPKIRRSSDLQVFQLSIDNLPSLHGLTKMIPYNSFFIQNQPVWTEKRKNYAI